MTKYAEGTTVSTEKSSAEIQYTLQRYGGTDFLVGQANGKIQVMFEMQGRRVRFAVPLPQLKDFERDVKGHRRSLLQVQTAYAQANRQRYRALLLVIKSKLESIESGIETFDEAFMSNLVLRSGETMGEWYKPEIENIYSGKMPPLLLPAITEGE